MLETGSNIEFSLKKHNKSVFQLIDDSWKTSGAWPDQLSAMRLVLPRPGDILDTHKNPEQWIALPGLCCLAAGGELAKTRNISAAWLLLYTAAHVVDTVEDGDFDPQVSKLGGTGAAINTANGLFLSAIMHLQSLDMVDIPQDLAAQISSEYLKTIMIMTSGQHIDLTTPRIDLGQWWQIAEAKSGTFFSLACRTGARLGESDQEIVNSYSEYGFHLGLMLQIRDDLEDFRSLVESSRAVSPAAMARSLAVVYACDVLPDKSKDEIMQIMQARIPEQESANVLLKILDSCGAGMYMLAELEKHFNLGMAALAAACPTSPAREKLESYIHDLKIAQNVSELDDEDML